MLILVAVTITMAVNGGLFEYAGRAGTKTNGAIANEQEFANLEANMTVNQLIDKYTGEAGAGSQVAETKKFSAAGIEITAPKDATWSWVVNNSPFDGANFTSEGVYIVWEGDSYICKTDDTRVRISEEISDGYIYRASPKENF